MKISKKETQSFQNRNACTVYKYDFPSEFLGLITAEINGRYPEEGKVLNEICDETYYVQSGSCTIHHETGEYNLSEGDVFYFARGKSYWVEADQLRLVVCTAPPWTPEQHRNLT